MYRYLITLICMGLLMLTGACCKNKCGTPPQTTIPADRPADLTAEIPAEVDHSISSIELSEQTNAFAFNLLHEVDQAGENLFFSPYSINTALGMAYTGARGNTASEMAKVMGYAHSPAQQYYNFDQSLKMMESINRRNRAQVQIANGIFSADTNKGRLVPNYLNTLQKYFGSEIEYLDFSQAAKSADFINTWVQKQTQDRIKDIVSEKQIADSNDGLVLVNSIYFKSAWITPFLRQFTVDDTFYTSSQREESSSIKIPMMQQKAAYYYAEIPEGQIIELPFEDHELSMIFMLPKDIDAASQDLNAETWQSWMKHLSASQRVELIIPRFRLEQSLDKLPENFRAMGMRDAFNAGRADFTGILAPGKDNLYISEIVHKAFLEVLEEGTEAAAATQVGFAKTSIEPPMPNMPVFRADKPFLCMIIHKQTKEILFMAKVVKPIPAK